MRRFNADNFPHHLAEGANSPYLSIPDDEARRALEYVQQFVYLSPGRSELVRGYISEDFVDALVRIRDKSDSRDFTAFVEAIGADGRISSEIDDYAELVLLEIENSFEAEGELGSFVRNTSWVSGEARDNLYSVCELITDNRGDAVNYFIPREVYDQLQPGLGELDIQISTV